MTSTHVATIGRFYIASLKFTQYYKRGDMQRLQAIIGNGLLYRWDNVWVFNKQEIEEMKELDLMELTKRIESKTKTRL